MQRVVKHAVHGPSTGSRADRYAPRWSNVASWEASGPFTRRSTAERAAARALAVHTCLAVHVAGLDQLRALAAAPSYCALSGPDGCQRAARFALALVDAAAPAEAIAGRDVP